MKSSESVATLLHDLNRVKLEKFRLHMSKWNLMKRRLPNLNALRVFETAARHLSFTQAADELGVTQSAVSKQVALLEIHFGQALFVRQHRQISLTHFGQEVAKSAELALAVLHERLETINSRRNYQLRLLADADFVHLWLFRILPEFEAAHSDIRISIETRIGMNMPPDDHYDCAVIWGRGAWSDCRFEPLITNEVFPVAAPGFFDHLQRSPTLADVSDDMLIHDQSTFWWSALRAAAGIRSFNPDAGRIYNQTALCLEAAMRGDGVTVGDKVTTANFLRGGHLICPFRDKLPSPDSYFIVTPRKDQHSDEQKLFIAWLKGKAKNHQEWWRDYWPQKLPTA